MFVYVLVCVLMCVCVCVWVCKCIYVCVSVSDHFHPVMHIKDNLIKIP